MPVNLAIECVDCTSGSEVSEEAAEVLETIEENVGPIEVISVEQTYIQTNRGLKLNV